MSIHRSFVVIVSLLFGVGALGCSTQGQVRNPTFTSATAPDPAVVVTPIGCRSEFAGRPGDALQSQFSVLLKAELRVKPVALDGEQMNAVCASMAGWSQGVKDWKARAALGAVVQSVAESEHAETVLVPVAKYATNCLRDEATIKDAEGRAVARIDKGTQTCKEGAATLLALLFSADGALLWKSWAVVQGGGVGPGLGGMVQGGSPFADADKSIDGLLANIPAKFVDAGGGGRVVSPEGAAAAATKAVAPAADPATVEGPAECKELVRIMCDRLGPAPSRARICAGYVSSFRAIATTPNGAKICKAQLAAVQSKG